eukprot:1178988-Prorocentrum_minimum.AAC.1
MPRQTNSTPADEFAPYSPGAAGGSGPEMDMQDSDEYAGNLSSPSPRGPRAAFVDRAGVDYAGSAPSP